ncbi:hypothetical protein BOSP111201_26950 [Bordetella sputigena]|uniref:hypothetical protein n=1 Tax=Bordetella sputigena TaxID=1416810 RepID=UPI0039F09607
MTPLEAKYIADDLLHRYWWEVDLNEGYRAHEFYRDDALYDMCGSVMRGPAAVAAYYQSRRTTQDRVVRHVISNLFARMDEAQDGIGINATLCLYAGHGPIPLSQTVPSMIADVSAIIRPDGHHWRFVSHTLSPIFRVPGSVLHPPSTAN